MDLSDIGKWLLLAGVALALAGGALWLLGRWPWAGRLPGDINVQVGNVSCFAPIATLLILSVLLTVILNVLLRLFNNK